MVTGSGIWASVGLALLLITLFGGGLVSVWAAFLGRAGDGVLMWRRFQRTVREFPAA